MTESQKWPADTRPLSTSPDATDADRHRRRVALASLLDGLDEERSLAEAMPGGVPIPREWVSVQAVLGGVRPRDLSDAWAVVGRPGESRIDAHAALHDAVRYGAFLPPGIHVFTGHTGGGKSATAVNLARAAIENGHPVVYASLELDGREIAARVLALESGLPWSRLYLRRPLRDGVERATRRASIDALKERLASLFYVWVPDAGAEGPAATARDLREEVLAVWHEHNKTPLVIFDYLQAPGFMPGGVADTAAPLRERVAGVIMQLRHLSREILSEPAWVGCPVVALSITARANVTGQNVEPGMNGECPDDLRKANLEALKALPKEAGEIEATSVTSWVLAIESQPTNPHSGTELCMRLVKNRLGPVGHWIPFLFRGATGRLEEDTDRYRIAAEKDREAAEARNNGKAHGAEPKPVRRGTVNGML